MRLTARFCCMLLVVALKEIFKQQWDNFAEYAKANNLAVRSICDEEIRKVIDCGNLAKGFTIYECDCGETKFVPFRCKSRVCNCCGYQYQKFRAEKVKSKLIKCSHRHIVFTIAKELRVYFRKNRSLLHVLFHSAADTISQWLLNKNKSQKFKTGMISTLHTFGRDLKWNPHIHMLMAMVKVGETVPFQKLKFIPFEMLRKRFMTTLLHNLKEHIPKSLIDKLYIKYPDGFYVHAPSKEDVDVKDVVNYIVRYIGRPVIAQKRILKFENDIVTFCYNRHEDGEYVEENLHVFEFIKKVIIHIPDKYFNMLRYYGLYATGHDLYLLKKKLPQHLERQRNSWRIRILASFGFDPIRCKCGKIMRGTIVLPNTS